MNRKKYCEINNLYIDKIRLEKKLNKIADMQEKFNSFYKDQKDINKYWFVSNFNIILK